tara:strand:- start:1554 stop:2339 length:786 start_codon:yes stop_codon:yes gene_type:complete
MGNCCSNFVGDDDQSMELEGSHHINADGGFDMESSEFMEDINSLNASGANEGDMNLGFGEDAGWEMGTGATSYTGGVDVQGGSAGDGGSWVNQMSYFDGEVENGDEFDNFLTKRMRGRRKLRKTLRKDGGLTRKEARKSALASIPKQNLIKTIGNAMKGKTSPETQALIDKGLLSPNKNIMAGQVSEAVAENEAEGTQSGADVMGGVIDALGGMGETSQTPAPAAAEPKKAGMGTMMYVGIGAVVLIGAYFAFGKKLGIRG